MFSRLGVGEYFGEIALLTNKKRQLTVRASEPTVTLSLDRAAFNRLCGPLVEILKRNMESYSQLGYTDAELQPAQGSNG
jgi:cAMP-dependent protein kinase regulator